MGTPGDKTKISKVVRGEPSQLDPEQEEEQEETVPKSVEASETIGLIQEQPSTSSITEMGIYGRLPEFESFSGATPLLHTTEKPEQLQSTSVSLEQATIEDYFVQSKYYPSISETVQAQFPQPPEKPTETFPSLDQPGPSGLQKTKQSVTKLGLKRTKKAQPTKRSHVCQICQKSFLNATRLAKHQQIHGGTSPFKCEHCKKSFSSKFKLVRHALIHSDRKPFSCSVCERTFHRKDHLKNHIKVHSPSKKIHICEKLDCKKEYTSLLSYRKHLALHAAEEGSLECQICFNTFETKEQILYHLKIHAGSRTVKNPNEKKFTCEHCDRKFFTKKDVRRHLVVHTGMRDFLCQFCPQRFGRKDHLVRHIKKSHSKNLPFEAQQDLETAIKSELPEMLIKSEVSESSVSNPEQLPSTFEFNIEQFGTEKIEPIENIEVGGLLFPILPPQSSEHLQFLPSTSAQPELKDLGSGVLEGIGESSSQPELPEPIPEDLNPELLEETVLIGDSEIIRLLQSSEDKNLPLPGFSQTFQSPPPPPPPKTD